MNGWMPIGTAPSNKGFKEYTVSDGRYIERTCCDSTAGWYRLCYHEDIEPLDPQPTHWLPDEVLLRLMPVPPHP